MHKFIIIKYLNGKKSHGLGQKHIHRNHTQRLSYLVLNLDHDEESGNGDKGNVLLKQQSLFLTSINPSYPMLPNKISQVTLQSCFLAFKYDQ